jgi:putative glutamine amidotransferase
MPRPLIGVCAAVEPASFGVWKNEPAVLLPLSYSRAIHGAGGMMAMLPPDRRSSEDPGELLDRIDALILGGGADIDPETQGVEAHPETIGSNPDRDRFEISLALGALERGLPLLGVCRGMQIMNVARGGTLHQHLPEHLGHEQHRPTPGEWAQHEVRLAPGSLAARAAGGERLTIRSHHHQGIETVGEGFEQTGWATEDDIVEAIESPDGSYVLGVLWHPEEDVADRVIPALVEQAGT